MAVMRCLSGVGSSMNASRDVAWVTSPAASSERWIHFWKMSKMVEMASWYASSPCARSQI